MLLLRRDQQLQPLIHGGSQQRARSGTQDAAAAVAFATALQLASPTPEKLAKLSALRDRILAGVIAAVPEAILRGADPRKTSDIVRIPGNLHFTFPGCQGDSLLFLLDQAGGFGFDRVGVYGGCCGGFARDARDRVGRGDCRGCAAVHV